MASPPTPNNMTGSVQFSLQNSDTPQETSMTRRFFPEPGDDQQQTQLTSILRSSRPNSSALASPDQKTSDSYGEPFNTFDGTNASVRRGKKPAKALLKRSFSLVPERFTDVESASKRARKSMGHKSPLIWCESLMKLASIILFLLTMPLSLIICLRVITQYQRAVIFRLGRLMSKDARGPGLVFLLPCLDTLKKVDLRTFTFDVPTQEVLTKDSVTVAMEAVVYYRIFDPVMSVVNVEDANRSTRLLAQTTLRNVLGTVDLYTLLTEREEIAAMMQETLDVATDTWGVKVERVEVKDVRLPTQLQRAMAAEAEATREAKAKVIAAKGEQLASRALKEAAIELSECPVAIQLRYLQTLNNISAEKNSTIIFPLPLDFLQHWSLSRSAKSKTATSETVASSDCKKSSLTPKNSNDRQNRGRHDSSTSLRSMDETV